MTYDLEANKRNAIVFYRTAYLGDPRAAVEQYVGDRYIQHNPDVALHTYQVWPEEEAYVTMDFFRFDENGTIVEHWDAIQTVPNTSRNGNSMV